jgi:hypothetical protein
MPYAAPHMLLLGQLMLQRRPASDCGGQLPLLLLRAAAGCQAVPGGTCTNYSMTESS